MTVLSENRKARFDYTVIETLEVGIELRGFEVKSVKAGRMNLAGSYAVPKTTPRGSTELCLLNADIPPYQPNNTPDGYDPARSRRLLITRAEVARLLGKLKSERLTIVPLKVYSAHGLVKVELALARPKQKSDKREAIKKREAKRDIERTLNR